MREGGSLGSWRTDSIAKRFGTIGQLHRAMLQARRLSRRVRNAIRKLLGRNRTVYLDDRVREYGAYWEAASKKLHASFHPICEGVWEVRRGDRRTRIANYRVQIDDPVTLHLAGNKAYCLAVANRLGIPTAPHLFFRLGELDDAWNFMASHGGCFVVKPSAASAGLGLTTHVRTHRQLESAAILASLYGEMIMLERMVPAESCRLLYLDGELIHAVRRRGARIVGDGHSSIRALLARTADEHVCCDEAARFTLETQGLSLESRIVTGREVVARYIPAIENPVEELRTIYNESITSVVSPQLALSLGRLVEEVGSRLAGVDVLTNDPGVSLSESGGVFLELNTTPGLHHHYVDNDGPMVTERVLRFLLSEDRPKMDARFTAGEQPPSAHPTGPARAADCINQRYG